jgi:hypothetical protein
MRREMRGMRVTGEDIRQVCEKAGIKMNHVNAWGALVNSMKAQGWLRETGEMRAPADKRSKGKARRVYEVL